MSGYVLYNEITTFFYFIILLVVGWQCVTQQEIKEQHTRSPGDDGS